MDLRRLRAGEWILALSGVTLIVSLFLPWYRVALDTRSLGPDVLVSFDSLLTGWEAMTVNDVVLCLAGLLALAVFVVVATQKTVAVPIALTTLATILAMLALVLALVRLVLEPAPEGLPAGVDPDMGRRAGAWLGVAAAAAMTVGGWIAMRDERLSRPGAPTDSTGRPVAQAPEIEAMPPPGPSG